MTGIYGPVVHYVKSTVGAFMTYRVFAGLLSAIAISSALCEASEATGMHKAVKASVHANAKTHRASQNASHARHYRSAALIPPPPAYMPCVLPELYYRGTASGVTEISSSEEKKENPYSQYVKSPAGEAPEALASRKGVVTWHAHR